MSLDKAIAHGKERRKPYRGSKSIDPSCRNHGGCPWCGAKMDAIVLDKNHAFEAHVDDSAEAIKEYIFHGLKIME